MPLGAAHARRKRFVYAREHIGKVRARHGLSQQAFAAALGLDVRTPQNWEQGRNKPDDAVLLLIDLFDHDPAAVADALYPPAAPAAAE